MWQRFTENARRVIFFAQEEAGRLNMNYVGTEHLLLGLTREDEGSMAGTIFSSLKLSGSRIRSELEVRIIGGSKVAPEDLHLNEEGKHVIDLAYEEACALDQKFISTAHLLLGLLREKSGLGGKTLRDLGLELSHTRAVYVQQIEKYGDKEGDAHVHKNVQSSNNKVFISYRRDGGAEVARLIRMALERESYKVFLDVDDLNSACFGERLLSEIESAKHFILILTKNCLDRCLEDSDDWLLTELSHALSTNRNIVPLVMDGFAFPDKTAMPKKIADLPRFNSVIYSHEYFTAMIQKLISFLK